jgi:hypothetical protein
MPKCFRAWSWVIGKSCAREKYQVHSAKMSSWPAQEIQSDSPSKTRDQQESNEKQTRNKSHVHKHGTYVN